jgi:hypothetical protein
MIGEQFGYNARDRLLGLRRTGRRGRPLQLGEDPAISIDNPRRDLRATDINTDG